MAESRALRPGGLLGAPLEPRCLRLALPQRLPARPSTSTGSAASVSTRSTAPCWRRRSSSSSGPGSARRPPASAAGPGRRRPVPARQRPLAAAAAPAHRGHPEFTTDAANRRRCLVDELLGPAPGVGHPLPGPTGCPAGASGPRVYVGTPVPMNLVGQLTWPLHGPALGRLDAAAPPVLAVRRTSAAARRGVGQVWRSNRVPAAPSPSRSDAVVASSGWTWPGGCRGSGPGARRPRRLRPRGGRPGRGGGPRRRRAHPRRRALTPGGRPRGRDGGAVLKWRRRSRSWSSCWRWCRPHGVAAGNCRPAHCRGGPVRRRPSPCNVASWSERRRWATVVPLVIAVLFVVGGVDDGNALPQAVKRLRPRHVIGLP